MKKKTTHRHSLWRPLRRARGFAPLPPPPSLRLSTARSTTLSHRHYEAGQWLTSGEAQSLLAGEVQSVNPLQLSAGADLVHAIRQSTQTLDVIFPVLHGTFGEDGTIQGLFELADLAYVGSGVLGSATGMDKATMKQLFAAAGLPQTPHVALLRNEWKSDPKRCTKLIEEKPYLPGLRQARQSWIIVGISKVHNRRELATAMDLAAGFDRKLIIEQGVGGPEQNLASSSRRPGE